MRLLLENVTKAFGNVLAVDNISCALDGGQIAGLVGPNGAGKTTLLNIIANFVRSDSGRVTLEGDPLPPGLAAYVPEFPDLFPVLTVWEHFKFIATAHSISQWEPKALEYMDKFNIRGKKDAFAGDLSRGTKQKLAIGICLLREPEILLLDEPFSNLDPASVRELRNQIETSKSPGRIILISSHNLESIQHLCSRVLIMNQGKLVRNQKIDAILEEMRNKGYRSLEDLFLEVTENAGG